MNDGVATISSQNSVDPVADLNMVFRTLYGDNRDQFLAEIPLAALTLIGTGEIWRVEYGQFVKCYQPVAFLPKAKGLMHAVLGAHGTWGQLLRKRDAASSQAALRLDAALGEASERVSTELPPELASPARAVLAELKSLSQVWRAGGEVTRDQLPAALRHVTPQLREVIRGVADAAFDSHTRNFRKMKEESDPDHWRQCYVGVCGPGQGRRDSLEIAAAMSVMGREALGVRLFYLDNVLTIPEGLKILASVVVEKDLGRAVFDDPYRMWRDILGDVAIEHAGGSFFPELGPQAATQGAS